MSSAISVANVEIPSVGMYTVDTARSSLTLTAKHMFGLGTVRARVSLLDGTIIVPEQTTDAGVSARAHAESFSSGNLKRDAQVVSAKFLDAKNHPSFRFESSGVERDADGWVVRGQLLARGIAAPLDLRISELSMQGNTLHARAEGIVDRYAHGITKMKGLAGRHIKVSLDAFAQRQPGPAS